MTNSTKDSSKLKLRFRKWRSVLYDTKKKTICGRGFLAWAQISLFYCIFYAFLAGFFISMLVVVRLVTPTDRPLYFMGESTMATIYPLNPGVGFRPQPNVNSESIVFDKGTDENGTSSYRAYVSDLDNFLNQYYSLSARVDECSDGQRSSNACRFQIEGSSECNKDKGYGYPVGKPCVLLKMNRLYGWKSGGMPRCPEDHELSEGNGNLGSGGDVRIKCTGETDMDVDAIQSIQYLSYNGVDEKCGSLPNTASYYPFLSQHNYQSPYVWAQLDVKVNTMVSLICRAYGDNIDNKSKLPMRGMTRVKILVKDRQVPESTTNITTQLNNQ